MSVLLRDRESRVVLRNEAFQKWEPSEVQGLGSLPYQGICRQPLLASRTPDAFTTPIPFTGGRYPDYVASIRGLSTSEGWATWSDGSTIVITFSRDLPSSFDFELKFAAAFEDNRGQPFTVSVGHRRQTFVVDSQPGGATLRFRDVGKVRTLAIEIPKPQSPLALGIAGDSRKLGIALVSLAIVPQDELHKRP